MSMSGFWWGVMIVAVLWLFFLVRPKAKAIRAFSVCDEADPWFQKNNINPNSVIFSTYEDTGLARNSGAAVVVGESDDVGFALEVVPGEGVVSSEIIVPFGIASHHRTASIQAKMSGQPLLDVLIEKAENHRMRYPE